MAEIQHQNRLAEQRQRAAAREQAAATRRSEQAIKAAQRAQAAATRASDADRKRLEKEAAAAHVAAQQAQVDELNARLAANYDRVDTLLEATLDVDDYVDLKDLRRTVVHPPFDRQDLRDPIPEPPVLPDPEPPAFQEPPAPSGIFGRKRKRAEAEEKAKAAFEQERSAWEYEMKQLPVKRRQQTEEHAQQELIRQQTLKTEIERYKRECEAREKDVAEHNASIDQFTTDLSYGVVDAVQEYIGIVLANSVYPEGFVVEHESSFDPDTAELSLRVLIPGPDTIPTVKAYRYVKASDEISHVALSQKDAKNRYLGIIHQVTLRTLHEVFEADRRGLVQSIALEIGTETVNPATGRETYIPMAAVGAFRESFLELDLSAVVPAATLEHLGATVSKNPLGLVPIDGSGVRRSS
ncbi:MULTISPECIES: hypothetical protein [unclassified Arthrobacter]|uniref:hypothetical protein n=1 Tax=unclassified Arthrobacter TaxID=235627 RepID=UPI0021586825|nr:MULTISPECIES: hypothetical protein [unclassified Arthrobacter]